MNQKLELTPTQAQALASAVNERLNALPFGWTKPEQREEYLALNELLPQLCRIGSGGVYVPDECEAELLEIERNLR